MTMTSKLLAIGVLLTSAQIAFAGTSACDGQTLTLTNTTGSPIYLVDRDIKGNSNFDNIRKNESVAPYSETVIDVSSGPGTRGNASAVLHFSKNQDSHVDTVDLELDFASGWSNYFVCKSGFKVSDNGDFFVTGHQIETGTQVIFYPKSAGFDLSDYISE